MSEKSSESRGIENENPIHLFVRFEAEGEYYAIYPNRWAYYRKHYLREAASEFLGCMVLVIFGTGVDLQVILSNNTRVASSPKGDMLSIHFGWAVGTALGVWTASVSGGHINPAVTLAFAVFRGFPWRKVPIYLLAQLSGACFGGLLTYSNYMHAIAIVDPGKTQATASLFTTYALDYMPNVACFFSEFLGTAVLLIIVLATADNANGPPPKGLGPLVLFIVILGEGVSLGMETAYALNPARDLGPRIALAMVGYSKQVLFDYRHQYWIWTPILGPVSGALIGTFVYDALMFTGPESVLNFP
ncbi:hypothetical protein BS47DRAFT_1372543 [Hydnum rufescens UP504]|uniref:Aquaporin n=1 Tax=Hydnum rufescens UP504 TaxID=1448309 RepID=A0A9P6AWU0_9AGAM|nr:hypothetical protein BS47DRAFT_1372543 [Hydnum rufescens UP504]